MTTRKGPRAAGKPPARRRLRVLIVDDHPLWRETLRKVLEHSDLAPEVTEASSATEALSAARADELDVIVMDIALGGESGIDATRAILDACPAARVLVLSSSDDRTTVLEAVAAGASGYLIKTAGSAEIVDALRRIAAGELVFPGPLADIVRAELRRAADGSPREEAHPLGALTEREREVLALIAEGRSNQAICERLFLAPKTVEAHVANIFVKLGLEATPADHRRVLAAITYLRSR